MESIFQIKINENKLQKIITDLMKQQSRQGEEIKNFHKTVADKGFEYENQQCLVEQRFQQKWFQLGYNSKVILQNSSAYFQNLRGRIDKLYRQMESTPSKLFLLEGKIALIEKLSQQSKNKILIIKTTTMKMDNNQLKNGESLESLF